MDAIYIHELDKKFSYKYPLIVQLLPNTENQNTWTTNIFRLYIIKLTILLLKLDTHTDSWVLLYFIFRNFKIYNQGEDIIFETKIWQTSTYTFNPGDFYRIVGVRIDYLDPIGATANGYTFNVKGSNFKIKKSYEDDGISTVKFRFVVDISSIKLLNKNLNG